MERVPEFTPVPCHFGHPRGVADLAQRAASHEQEVGRIDRRAVAKVMVSSAAPRPEWICHWLVAPIWVNVAPCAAVPKPTKCSESPAPAPLPAKSTTMSPLACPALNTKVSLPAPPVSLSAPAPPLSVLSPALPKMLVVQRVAGAGQIAGPLQHQGFHVRRQRVVDRGEHRVGALVEFSITLSPMLSTK